MNGTLQAPVVLREHDDSRVEATVDITGDEPVFAGHYPDFPILPGVCVLDCVHRTALASARSPIELEEVERCRFTAGVRPDGVLRVCLDWSGLLANATVHFGTDQVAKLKLRYRERARA